MPWKLTGIGYSGVQQTLMDREKALQPGESLAVFAILGVEKVLVKQMTFSSGLIIIDGANSQGNPCQALILHSQIQLISEVTRMPPSYPPYTPIKFITIN